MSNKTVKNKILLICTLCFALGGIVFSLLYLIGEIFIPSVSALCLCLMFVCILLILKENPKYFTKKQNIVIKIIIWIGLVAGFLAALIQMFIFLKL